MREEDSEGLKAFEAALASLVPRADRLDRDRLMFLAGQQSRTGFQPVENAGAMPTLAVGMSETSGKSQHAHGRRGHGTPASRWAWPAAFTAMTAVAVALAILLAIRPAGPIAGPDGTSIVANANDTKRMTPNAHSQNQDLPPASIDSEQDYTARFQPPSPWITFIQSFGSAADPANAIDSDLPTSGTAPFSYPQMRDRILRYGLDSWQVAQTVPGHFPANFHEPSTRRELLKEYLPELQ
ncbi:MAG: hypothetical protein IT426_18865 [Pirellulales bacterium]|nr:hypothetical protein [Pirellulales bacterium]